MKNDAGSLRRWFPLGFAVLLGLCGAAAHASAKWKPPLTEHKQPDLQGLWDIGTQTPFQRPTNLGEKRAYTEEEALEFERKARAANAKLDAPIDLSKGAPQVGGSIGQEADMGSVERRHDLTRVNGEYRTSIIVDPPNGRIPVKKGFKDFYAQAAGKGIAPNDGPDTLDASTRCLTPLPVPSIFPMPWSAYLQIVQTKDQVVLISEAPQHARNVRLQGTHLKRDLRFWAGDSIGHWEGNTLVVHTTNFRPEQSFAFVLGLSEDFELTERFTRTGPDEVLYAFTIVDPNAFAAPFSGERTIKRADPRDRMLETACHEGNYAMTGILAGARKLERDAAEKATSNSVSASSRDVNK